MSKVYGYCRTARQGNIEEQVELVTDYCKEKGLNLTMCFCDDGVSAHNMSREGLDKLFDVLKDGDIIVTKDMSRLARNPKNGLILADKILSMGVEIIYVDKLEEEDDNPSAIEDWIRSKLD